MFLDVIICYYFFNVLFHNFRYSFLPPVLHLYASTLHNHYHSSLTHHSSIAPASCCPNIFRHPWGSVSGWSIIPHHWSLNHPLSFMIIHDHPLSMSASLVLPSFENMKTAISFLSATVAWSFGAMVPRDPSRLMSACKLSLKLPCWVVAFTLCTMKSELWPGL